MRRSTSRATEPVRSPRLARLAAGAVVALAAFAVAGLLIRVDCLRIEAPAGTVRALFPLGFAGRADFSLSFIHSVAKLPVEELFRPVDGQIELFRTVYQGLGAGLPFTDEGGTARLEGGSIVIDGLARRMDQIAVSPSAFTAHRLTVRGRRYDLFELIGGGGVAILAVDRMPLLLTLAYQARWKGEPSELP